MSDARILVIDDHLEMGRLLADQLGDAGYTVEVQENGAAAVARLRDNGTVYDVVLTDLRMEGTDGFDADLLGQHRDLTDVLGRDVTAPGGLGDGGQVP